MREHRSLNDEMPREVHEAVCYVVHDEHILVFTHRDVPMTVTGVQVPAGTVEVGESPEQAAVRELLEETGRCGHVVRHVGVQRNDLRPMRDEVVRHYFQMTLPDADVVERWPAESQIQEVAGWLWRGTAGGFRSLRRACWWQVSEGSWAR